MRTRFKLYRYSFPPDSLYLHVSRMALNFRAA